MNAWDNLPNAKHIDQVLSDVKANPEVFARAWHAAGTPRYAPWDAAASVGALRAAAYRAAGDAAWEVTPAGAWEAARSTTLALIAYDDSGKYLNMPYEKLKIWAELSEDPAAMLLLPYVWVREQLYKLVLDNKYY